MSAPDAACIFEKGQHAHHDADCDGEREDRAQARARGDAVDGEEVDAERGGKAPGHMQGVDAGDRRGERRPGPLRPEAPSTAA